MPGDICGSCEAKALIKMGYELEGERESRQGLPLHLAEPLNVTGPRSLEVTKVGGVTLLLRSH
jgi:hypothetical protein